MVDATMKYENDGKDRQYEMDGATINELEGGTVAELPTTRQRI